MKRPDGVGSKFHSSMDQEIMFNFDRIMALHGLANVVEVTLESRPEPHMKQCQNFRFSMLLRCESGVIFKADSVENGGK